MFGNNFILLLSNYLKKNYLQAYLQCNRNVQCGYLSNGALYRLWITEIEVNSKLLLNFAN